MKIDKTNKKTIGFVAIGAGVLITGIWVALILKKKKQDKGATDFYDKAEKLLDPELASDESKAFDPTFWEQAAKEGSEIITQSKAEELAKEIHSELGYVNIDEQAIYMIYKAIKNQASMSRVAAAYYDIYNHDLLQSLKEGTGNIWDTFDDQELSTLMGYINSKELITKK